MIRRGFTLVEMMLATVLSAILLGGILMATAAISRDATRLKSAGPSVPDRALDLLRWDLTNAATLRASDDGQSLTLIGQCALDRKSLAPTGRLGRVVYRIDPTAHVLTRQQRLIDDEIHPEPWIEWVCSDAARIDVAGQIDATKADALGNVPVSLQVTITLQRASSSLSAEVRAR